MPVNKPLRRCLQGLIIVALAITGVLWHKSPNNAPERNPDPVAQEIQPKERLTAPLKKEQPSPDSMIAVTAQDVLASINAEAGGTETDLAILTAIIQCESEWQHYWEPWRKLLPAGAREGDVKISKGNVGFAQINRGVWEKPMAENYGLDIYSPTDNLKAAVVLYQWQGVAPWKQWSGHCFVPMLAKQGIDI